MEKVGPRVGPARRKPLDALFDVADGIAGPIVEAVD
jgi:hypothetical protein